MNPIALTASGVSQFLSDVPEVFNSAVTMITGNPVASLFVGITITSAGIALFHKVVRNHG